MTDSYTRRQFLFGTMAIAAIALAAACGGRIDATDTPNPNPVSTMPVTGESTQTATDAAPPLPPFIVFAGGSVTYGQGVARSATFPVQTIALLAPTRYEMVNVAVSGQTIATDSELAPMTIDPLYDANRSENIVVLYEGFNDLNQGASVEETFARMVAFGQARREVGFKVVVGTLLPSTVSIRVGTATGNAVMPYEPLRQRVNALIRANLATFADALADIGADPLIGVRDAAANPVYYQQDGLHPTAEGDRRIAAIMQAAILTL